jgi:hypothetical protein
MMGGKKEPVAIRLPNGSVVRLAQLGRALADGVEHGLNVGPRPCDDAKDLAGRPLLLPSFMQLTGEPGDLCFPIGSSPAPHLWCIEALSPALRLRALGSLLLALERRRIAHPRLRTTR